MADAQKTLISVEEANIEEAKFMSRGFVNPGVRNRAYINSLGAEILKNYLASNGVDVENLHNLHSISKILEKNDIADLMFPNIHIDVRVVFNEEQIFIPKSHFEKGILPNVYAVIKIDDDYKSAEFLGYFPPEVIEKKNENKDYYFVTKKQLLPVSSFIKTVKTYTGKSARYLTEEDLLRGRQLALSLNDHDISAAEEKELLELLLLSDVLRESVLEFDNFETLAYNAASEVVKLAGDDVMPAVAAVAAPEAEAVEELTEEDLEISDMEEETSEETLEEEPVEETLETTEPEEDLLGDSMLDDTPVAPLETAETEEFESIEEPEVNLAPDEPQVVHEVKLPKADDEISVDDILDRTIASIDSEPETAPDDVISDTASAGAIAGSAIAAAGAVAGAAAAGMVAAEAAEAAAAAEVAKDVVQGVSATVDVADDITEGVSETVDAVEDLATAEDTADISEALDEAPGFAEPETTLTESEAADKYEAPKDLSDIDKVESIASEVQEQSFEHETVDMHEMDVVPNDLYKEEDMDTLSDINNMEATDTTKQDEFIELHGISESEVVDLPMSDYVINEDGSTPMDKYMPVDVSDDSGLIEMPPLEGAIGDSLDIEDTISQTEGLLDDAMLAESAEIADELPLGEEVSDELLSDKEEETGSETEDKKPEEASDEPSEAPTEDDEFNIEDFEQLLDDEEAAAGDETAETAETDEVAEETEAAEAAETLEETEAPAIEDGVTDIVEDDIADDALDSAIEEDLLTEPLEQAAEPVSEEQDEVVEMAPSAVPEQTSVEDEQFINMEDINRSEETMISEPAEAVVVTENSRAISGSNITVGEIPIDINNSAETPVDNTPLGNLYNPESKIPGESIMNNPGTMSRKTTGSSGSQAVFGIFGAIVVLVIVGIIGFFASKMINAPKEATPQPITDDNVPTSSDNGVSNQNTLGVDKNNVMNMDNNTNALASTSTASATEARKTGKATAFVDVKKLTWEVPDYISYNNNFREYFQSVGKSLKLALVSDLLLANDYIYSSPVKVSVTFDKDGTFRTSQLINSSGSTQIDSIVLQTVNQTLKSLKAPRSIGNDNSTTAILKIYF